MSEPTGRSVDPAAKHAGADAPPGWQFWIDRGGTFTDVVARDPSGQIHSRKLLSVDPDRYEDAALEGIRRLLADAGSDFRRDDRPASAVVDAVKMGTTVGTNALLERTGEPTLLCITRGFRDALRIGYQARPRLFDLHIRLPEPLYDAVLEIDERVTAKGEVLAAPDERTVRDALEAHRAAGSGAVAIAFVHGYRFPEHERLVARVAEEVGFTQISVSHLVSPLMKLVGRGDTTVVDAYLSPILRAYVDRVAAALGDVRLLFMQSNGGLTDAQTFRGKDSILSGPAGGIVGAVATTASAGFDRIITFDMGGTSTDVSHYAGEYERTFESEVAGVRVRAPMLQIHTVAAGGGSILHFDGARYRVGPQSAGADPGPASYRRSGPLTVTDANVMLGRIQPRYFPATFGSAGDEELDARVVATKFEALAAEIRTATGDERDPAEVADGFLRIAVDNMAHAIKRISIERGHDVTGYTLSCFGGAGGQHACRVADALGMRTVHLHSLGGVLSAYGMGLAETRVLREATVEAPLDDAAEKMGAALLRLSSQTRDEMGRQGFAVDAVRLDERVHVRYEGTDSAIPVENGRPHELAQRFAAAHRMRYGFTMERGLVVETVSVEAVGREADVGEQPRAVADVQTPPTPAARADMFADGAWVPTPLYARESLEPGSRIDGPAIVIEPTATIVVEPGWRAEVTALNHIVMRRVVPLPARQAVGTDVDPVMLEVFNNLFMSIAEQMGVTLRNTSYSVNIKERLDFSCAVFDAAGNLIANAPHMPVHLGAMGESVKATLRSRREELRPGDVFALNAPYNGGTHLPDVTVVTPVFGEADELLFWVASRGHHADIGGSTPGSMPPMSREVEEEGVLLDDVKLVDDGVLCDAEMRAILASGPYPARSPDVNMADLRAQVAANETGVRELGRMVASFGLDVVSAYMGHVQDNAEEQVRRVLDVLTDGSFRYELDNGAAVQVAISIDRGRRSAHIDFAGTSPQHDSNFNAPRAVCRAAVLYVFRTLIEDDIPLNDGCLKPLEIAIPEGSLLDPRHPAAVVAGNVETSQVITDALYGALGVLAGSQGTMNNFTFGDERVQYYETICGGSGAGPDFDGAGPVHTHMTNSRLTDPEVLEWRFPVLLETFRVRDGSGGPGRHRGGDGAVRRVRFLEPLHAAILSNRRRVPPFGLEGGSAGTPGRNRVERADGRVEELSGTDEREMRPGDVFVIETPGGGGFGAPA